MYCTEEAQVMHVMYVVRFFYQKKILVVPYETCVVNYIVITALAQQRIPL
jgi:hypothetical protein